MPEFLQLPLSERRAFIQRASNALQRSPTVLEKDIWVCWALEVLFKLELPMVFKGGTSLSKVYGAIRRFSEDLDITIDHKASADPIHDPLSVNVSDNKRREFSERMQQYTLQQVLEVIKPHFERHAQGLPISKLEVATSGDQLLIAYETSSQNPYLLPNIKLEFGARNAITPSELHLVKPDVLAWSVAEQLEFPSATVPVLLAERTFWEKVTLIHAEITRRNAKSKLERYSRHWYDLAQLAQSPIGAQALTRLDLRDHVIQTKTALFGVAGVNYELVARGECKLITQDELNVALEQDYEAMNDAGMFEGTPPTWADILETLSTLEKHINMPITTT